MDFARKLIVLYSHKYAQISFNVIPIFRMPNKKPSEHPFPYASFMYDMCLRIDTGG